MEMALKFMWHEVNYQVIIKTRSICMFRYMSHTIYLHIQVERGWLLKTDGDRRTMFRMVLKCRAATYLDSTWRPPGVFVGCTGTPTPLPAGCAISPWAYSCVSDDILLAVRSASVPDTP